MNMQIYTNIVWILPTIKTPPKLIKGTKQVYSGGVQQKLNQVAVNRTSIGQIFAVRMPSSNSLRNLKLSHPTKGW